MHEAPAFKPGRLFTNFLLGTERIIDAYAHSFRGGECEMAYPRISDICNKSIGFDSYYLILSALLVGFISGFRNVIRNMTLLDSAVSVIIHSILFLVATEFVIWTLRIPVLFTGFMEPRQHLEYALFSGILRRGGIEIIPSLLVLISIVGMMGNILGYPILFLTNKKSKSR